MKKGICMGCLPGDSIEAKFTLAKDAGFDGVEFRSSDDTDEVTQWKAAADQIGLETPSIMGGKHWSHPLSSPDADTRKTCNEAIKQDIRHAKQIGATAVLLVPAVVNEEATYEEAWERSIAEVKDIAAVAEENEIVLAIENVWNRFLLSPIEFRNYIDAAGSSWVKAYFDCGNILAYGWPNQWIRSLNEQLFKIHVKGFNAYPNLGFPQSLESDVPWKQCRDAWLEVGYDDYLTVEIGAKKDDPEGSIRMYAEQLDKIIAGDL